MNLDEIMAQLEAWGNPGTKKILTKHGAKEPFYGVKVGDLKKLVKKIKKDHELSLALYETGNSDAMYLAGLIADESQISKAQLNKWIKQAYWYMLSEYTVAWLAADSPHGYELALKWIKAKAEHTAAAGWSTLSSWMSIKADDELDIATLEDLLDQVANSIHDQPNRVRYAMNGFVIACGSYVAGLTEKAQEVATKIGKVKVEMGGTACKVPLADAYIEKVIKADRIGKKRKMARC